MGALYLYLFTLFWCASLSFFHVSSMDEDSAAHGAYTFTSVEPFDSDTEARDRTLHERIAHAQAKIPDINGSRLYEAVENFNFDRAEQLLRRASINPNFQDPETGQTPLHLAAGDPDKIDFLQLLLTHSAINPNIPDNHGTPPIIDALCANSTRNLDILLGHKKGAHPLNVNITDRNRLTPLHWATKAFVRGCRQQDRDITIIEKLLQAGADPLASDNNGDTVLDYVREALSQPGLSETETRALQALDDLLDRYTPAGISSLGLGQGDFDTPMEADEQPPGGI